MESKLVDDLNFKRVKRVCFVEIILNYVLTIIKFVGGFISGSNSLISDGINSLGDIVSSTIFYIGNKISNKKADSSHQFGHEKVEALICLIFSLTLTYLTIFLIYNNVLSIINKNYIKETNELFLVGLIMGLSALFIKFFLFIYTFINSKITKSNLLKTQAIDHLSDSLSTFISIMSLLVIYFIPNDYSKIIDPIGSIMIGLIVIISLLKIIYDNSKILLDSSINKEKLEKIKKTILSVSGVYHIDNIRTRVIGNHVLMEVEISCNGRLSLEESHQISENVRDIIIKDFPEVKHVLVHVNPLDHQNENDL
mgnify:FL=1